MTDNVARLAAGEAVEAVPAGPGAYRWSRGDGWHPADVAIDVEAVAGPGDSIAQITLRSAAHDALARSADLSVEVTHGDIDALIEALTYCKVAARAAREDRP